MPSGNESEPGSQTVNLTEHQLIGKGTRRYCYQHPHDPDLCIKIPMAKKNGYLQQRREVRYYSKLIKRQVPTERITRYHGQIETSLGAGYVYDVIRDADGRVSRQLGTYLLEEPERYREYLVILKQLESYLFENLVLIYDLSPWNILCRKDNDNTLEPFIIDGVGDVVAVPVLNLSSRLVKQKIRRRWLRMINKMKNRYDWMSDYRSTHY